MRRLIGGIGVVLLVGCTSNSTNIAPGGGGTSGDASAGSGGGGSGGTSGTGGGAGIAGGGGVAGAAGTAGAAGAAGAAGMDGGACGECTPNATETCNCVGTRTCTKECTWGPCSTGGPDLQTDKTNCGECNRCCVAHDVVASCPQSGPSQQCFCGTCYEIASGNCATICTTGACDNDACLAAACQKACGGCS